MSDNRVASCPTTARLRVRQPRGFMADNRAASCPTTASLHGRQPRGCLANGREPRPGDLTSVSCNLAPVPSSLVLVPDNLWPVPGLSPSGMRQHPREPDACGSGPGRPSLAPYERSEPATADRVLSRRHPADGLPEARAARDHPPIRLKNHHAYAPAPKTIMLTHPRQKP